MTMRIPLACVADARLARLAAATGSPAIAALDGATLLGERAAMQDRRIPGRISAGGSCRLHDTADGVVALNLARGSDRETLPALFEDDGLDPGDDEAIAAAMARATADQIVARGRELGLAIAGLHETMARHDALPFASPVGRVGQPRRHCPRILDLSALWAGPLAAHLLWLAGAEVIKVESRTRPDAMRQGQPNFYDLLNQDKASVALDLRDAADRRALLALIADADIVIEAARPRALRQLDIDADALIAATPGLVWITITGHGATGEAAGWIGFGDDCGVAGGLSAALLAASGTTAFVGDAIADPLTGIAAAETAWSAWAARRGGRHDIAMSGVVADAIGTARAADADAFHRCLRDWSASAGAPFPAVRQRSAGTGARPFGADRPAWRAC